MSANLVGHSGHHLQLEQSDSGTLCQFPIVSRGVPNPLRLQMRRIDSAHPSFVPWIMCQGQRDGAPGVWLPPHERPVSLNDLPTAKLFAQLNKGSVSYTHLRAHETPEHL